MGRKKNAFQLQQILDLKTSTRDALEGEFAELRSAYQLEVETAEALAETEQQAVGTLLNQQVGTALDCEAIQIHQSYLRALSNQRLLQERRVEQAMVAVEEKRQEVVKAVQDQKTLEKLKENHKAQLALKLARQESRVIDDLVISRHNREK